MAPAPPVFTPRLPGLSRGLLDTPEPPVAVTSHAGENHHPYKTIVLELIQEQYLALHEQLRKSRTPLSTVNDSACARKRYHEEWTDRVAQARPERTRARSRARSRSWRFWICGKVYPESHRRTTRSRCPSTQ
jgi:hypothetical protein